MIDWQTIDQLLEEGQRVEVQVSGVSMYPAMFSGDKVVFEPANQAENGDVVLARTKRGYRVHRLVVMPNGQVLLKGDNSSTDDGPGFEIRGRVSAHKKTLIGRLKRLRYGLQRVLRILRGH